MRLTVDIRILVHRNRGISSVGPLGDLKFGRISAGLTVRICLVNNFGLSVSGYIFEKCTLT